MGCGLRLRCTGHDAALSLSANGYTGDGLRAWKSDASGRTYYLYDGADPIAELDSSGNIQAVNTFGAQGLVSRRTLATNASVFYTFDERGNVAQRLNSSGSVLSTDLYDAFGARTGTALPETGSSGDPWGFVGQWGYQTDNETGLVLCTHRYYDPQQGRFLTRDPLGYDGGVNLYGYTQNNPVNYVDPDGYVPYKKQFPFPDRKPTLADILQAIAEDDPFPEFGPHPPVAPNRPTPPPARKPPVKQSGPPSDWPDTHDKIPGGPWEWNPNPRNSRGGSFRGPVARGANGRGGAKPELSYSKNPRGPGGYWKCNRPGGVVNKYDPEGNPLGENDQGHSPSGGRK